MSDRFGHPVEFASTTLFIGAATFQSAVIENATVKTAAAISADKLNGRVTIPYTQATGSDVASATVYVHLCRSAGTVKSIEVRPITAPTGGDKAFTVDVKKASDTSGTLSTLLSSVITVNSSSADHTRQQGSLIGSPVTVDGDVIAVVIAASGSTGSQGDGVIVQINLDEEGV